MSLLPRFRGRLFSLRRHVELPTQADRPDEGAVKAGRVRENPPHPGHPVPPKSFASTLSGKAGTREIQHSCAARDETSEQRERRPAVCACCQWGSGAG
jgi:hypothetical protein